MTIFTFLRFTKQLSVGKKIFTNSPLQQQLKETIFGTKTLKAQPYLVLKRIYTEYNPQSIELLFLDR